MDAYADTFASYLRETHGWTSAQRADDIDSALAMADLVILATTAPAPGSATSRRCAPTS